MKKGRPELSWRKVSFANSTFWVQAHGLLALWQSSDNLRKIGSKVGSVLDIEFIGSGGKVWRRFSRIQVEVAIAKPLLPGFFLPRADLPDLWISLKYEKLADVCYNCGTIGHEDRYSSASCFRLQNPQGNSFKATGQWLRTDNDEVPHGIYDEP